MSLPQSDAALAVVQMQGIKGNDILLGWVNEQTSHAQSQYRRVFPRSCVNKSLPHKIRFQSWVYAQKDEEFSGDVLMLMESQWVDDYLYQRKKHNDLLLKVKDLSCCFKIIYG